MPLVRRFVPLIALVGLLITAFVLLPGPLAGNDFPGQGRLVAAVHQGFVGYWQAGSSALPPPLQHVVDYWFRFHLVKGLIAALLLATLIVLGVRLRRSLTGAALVAAGGAVVALGVLATVAVMANIQGMVAPFGSLFPMLLERPATPPLTAALTDAGRQLAAGGRFSPAVQVMVDQFVRYHAAMAVMAAVLTVLLAGLAATSWRRFAKRRQRALMPALWSVLTVAPVILLIANVSSVADPVPSLLGLVRGGW
ncbi:hypothetical protein [Actinoplanes sp. NPDC026619]|uniref:hypothetical protein n=1 Tax=Actinoplanes sp. NPDC026619 TaxID=3155798 RepID=UPI0033F9FF7C